MDSERGDLSLAAHIHDRLDHLMADESLMLSDLSPRVEDVLLDLSRSAVISACLQRASELGTEIQVDAARELFFAGARNYTVNLGEIDPGKLDISIQNVARSTKDAILHYEEAPIEGVGRFGSVTLRVSPSFAKYAEHVVPEVRDLLVAGYRWLEHTIDILLNNAAFEIAQDLYASIRMHLSPETCKDIVLLVFLGEEGRYMFDHEARDDAKDRLKRRRRRINSSPIEQGIALERTTLKKSSTLTWHSLSRGEVATGQLLDAQYSVDVADLYEAERAAMPFRQGTFLARALVHLENGDLLAAIYPAKIDHIVEPKIVEIARRCRAIVGRNDRSLRPTMKLKTLPLLHMKSHIVHLASQVMGGFTRGYFGG